MSPLKREIGGAAKEAAGKVEKEAGRTTGKHGVEAKGKMREESGKMERKDKC